MASRRAFLAAALGSSVLFGSSGIAEACRRRRRRCCCTPGSDMPLPLPLAAVEPLRTRGDWWYYTIGVNSWAQSLGNHPPGEYEVEVVRVDWYYSSDPRSHITSPLGASGSGRLTLPNILPYGVGVFQAVVGGVSGRVEWKLGPLQLRDGVLRFRTDPNPRISLAAGVNDTVNAYGDNTGNVQLRLRAV